MDSRKAAFTVQKRVLWCFWVCELSVSGLTQQLCYSEWPINGLSAILNEKWDLSKWWQKLIFGWTFPLTRFNQFCFLFQSVTFCKLHPEGKIWPVIQAKRNLLTVWCRLCPIGFSCLAPELEDSEIICMGWLVLTSDGSLFICQLQTSVRACVRESVRLSNQCK